MKRLDGGRYLYRDRFVVTRLARSSWLVAQPGDGGALSRSLKKNGHSVPFRTRREATEAADFFSGRRRWAECPSCERMAVIMDDDYCCIECRKLKDAV